MKDGDGPRFSELVAAAVVEQLNKTIPTVVAGAEQRIVGAIGRVDRRLIEAEQRITAVVRVTESSILESIPTWWIAALVLMVGLSVAVSLYGIAVP